MSSSVLYPTFLAFSKNLCLILSGISLVRESIRYPVSSIRYYLSSARIARAAAPWPSCCIRSSERRKRMPTKYKPEAQAKEEFVILKHSVKGRIRMELRIREIDKGGAARVTNTREAGPFSKLRDQI